MNIAIVDNSREDLNRLREALLRYASIHQLDLQIEGFSDAETFLAGYRPFLYTVVFLDIYMEKMTGIEAAEKIREVDDDVLLVFQTTSEEHRAEAFTWYASAYLIKSPDDGVLFRTLDHILHLHTEKNGKRFDFTSEKRDISLRYDEIVSLQASGNYIVITDRAGTSYRTRMVFSEVQQRLSQDGRFQSVIRGVLVNLDHVVRISGRTCQMTGGQSFPVSSRKSREMEQIWHHYSFDKLRRESMLKGR